MSSVRVMFVELEGSAETVHQVIAQFVERLPGKPVELRPALPAPDPAPAPLTLRSPELQERPTQRHKNGNRRPRTTASPVC